VAEKPMEIHVVPLTHLLIFHYSFFTVHSKPLYAGLLSQGADHFWSKPGELAQAELLPCTSVNSASKAEQED